MLTLLIHLWVVGMSERFTSAYYRPQHSSSRPSVCLHAFGSNNTTIDVLLVFCIRFYDELFEFYVETIDNLDETTSMLTVFSFGLKFISVIMAHVPL